MVFEWDRFLGQLPNLIGGLIALNVVSFSFRSLSFGPLLLEARRRKATRHYPLSDLVALMLMLQIGAGASLAISRAPGVEASTLTWNPPLDVYGTVNVMAILLLTTLWWWFDGAWMLNAAGVVVGWTRFIFLALWTPLAYVSHWMVFFGGCGVIATISSRRSGIRLNDSIARIDPIAYIGIFSFVCLGCGLFGIIIVRWLSHRIADSAFRHRMSSFRDRLREMERERADEARVEAACQQEEADRASDA